MSRGGAARRRRAAAVAIAAALSWPLGCGTPPHRAAWEGEADRAATVDLVRLHQARDLVDSAWERQATDRLRLALAADVVFAPPFEPEVIGRDEVLAWFERRYAGVEVRDTYVSESIHLAQEWAVETWTVDRRLRREDRPQRVRLKGVHLYRRGDDQRWLLAYRIWNHSPVDEAK